MYVLIPGAGGEAWYWRRVVQRLNTLGRDVVAPDLPAADDSAGLGEYADVVAEAAGDREGLIVVAQSMGAFVAPLLCERADVALLGLVAPMIPAPGESADQWWSATGQAAARRELEAREGRGPAAPFDRPAGFFPAGPAEFVAEPFAGGEPRQADRPFEEPWP